MDGDDDPPAAGAALVERAVEGLRGRALKEMDVQDIEKREVVSGTEPVKRRVPGDLARVREAGAVEHVDRRGGEFPGIGEVARQVKHAHRVARGALARPAVTWLGISH
jgi:hypothetical protein